MKDLISLMPEVLAALQSTGVNVSLAQDLEDAIEADRQRRGEPWKHDLYQTGDSGAPEQIKDGNGEVVLDLCKRCGKAEIELTEPCTAPQPAEPVKVPSDAEYDVVFIPIVLKQVG